jgi:hypothetical protein
MGSKRAATAVILSLAAAAAGCGESTVKRSVDARTEVLSFYSVDAPVVGLLRPQPAGELARLDRVAVGLPIWARLRGSVLGPLRAAGLGMSDLRRLVRPNEEIEGIDVSAMSFGAPTPTDLEAGQTLTVIATDQDELLDELLKQGVDSGRLQPRGGLDEAALYGNRVASYAERDGVLVSAPSPGVVRTAIARRDGDSDKQLDKDVVAAAIQKLSDPGPLVLYGNVSGLLDDPEVARVISDASWTESADDVAATARASADAVDIELVVNLERELTAAERPLEETPTQVDIRVPGLGPLSGTGSTSPDQIRVQLETAP